MKKLIEFDPGCMPAQAPSARAAQPTRAMPIVRVFIYILLLKKWSENLVFGAVTRRSEELHRLRPSVSFGVNSRAAENLPEGVARPPPAGCFRL
jgi:hypothetical protein